MYYLWKQGFFWIKRIKSYQRSEQAFVLALMEMVINGVSIRKMRRVIEELYNTPLVKNTDLKI